MAKVVLVGDKAVGKTSLIHRFVVDAFDDRYLLTLGNKVSKKVLEIPVPEKDLTVSLDMNIWDIMGQSAFRDLAKEAYFHGARGIIAVADLTRRDTLTSLAEWVRAVKEVTEHVSIVVVGNKKDLKAQVVTPAELSQAAETLGGACLLTSAKTGENVEAMFEHVATEIVRAYFRA